MNEDNYVIICAGCIIIVIFMVIFFPVIITNDIHTENIKNICGYIFNPATTLSNYTSYKHCLEYPQTYGVGK